MSDSDLARDDVRQRVDEFGRRGEEVRVAGDGALVGAVGLERGGAVDEDDAHVLLRSVAVDGVEQQLGGEEAEAREGVHLVKLTVVDAEAVEGGGEEVVGCCAVIVALEACLSVDRHAVVMDAAG